MPGESRLRPIPYAITMLLIAALACATPLPSNPTTPSVTGTESPTTEASPPDAAVPFMIGIEYAVPGLAKAYAPTGVAYAKPQPAFGVWGNIEPEAGAVDWGPIDTLVAEYQTEGFTGIQLLISAEAGWAQVRPAAAGDKGDSMPEEDHIDEYTAFVRAFVERYDGDGVDDARGLLYPVHHYGIERELTGYWPSGSADDYVRLLRIAYPVIKQADPDAQVLLVALLMLDVFDGNTPTAEIERRLNQPMLLGYDRATMETVLAACDSYDIVDFHSLCDYTEIPPTTAWIRAQLQANGCGDKPIWIGDAFSMSGLLGYTDPFGWIPPRVCTPATEQNRDAILGTLQSVADPSSPDHISASAWLWGEMARGLVKKIVVSAAAGLAGINIGNLEDWAMPGMPEVNKGLVRSAGTSIFMGMMDTTLTSRYNTGTKPVFADASMTRLRAAGQPRAAFYALQLVAERVQGFLAVERLELNAGVWAYRFDRSTGPVWVLWYNDGVLALPGDPLPLTDVILPVGGASIRITRTPTTASPAMPESAVATDGNLRLTLDKTPVFVDLAP